MKKIGIVILVILMMFLIGCQEPVVCNKPYIKIANNCCLDVNNNHICDKDEETRQIPEQEKTVITEEMKKADEIKAKLKVILTRVEPQFNDEIFIEGYIENTGRETAQKQTIEIKCLNTKGDIISSKTIQTTGSILPAVKSDFKLKLPGELIDFDTCTAKII